MQNPTPTSPLSRSGEIKTKDGQVWLKVFSRSHPSKFYFHNKQTGQNVWKDPREEKYSSPIDTSSQSSDSSANSSFAVSSSDHDRFPALLLQEKINQLAEEISQFKSERVQFQSEKVAFYNERESWKNQLGLEQDRLNQERQAWEKKLAEEKDRLNQERQAWEEKLAVEQNRLNQERHDWEKERVLEQNRLNQERHEWKNEQNNPPVEEEKGSEETSEDYYALLHVDPTCTMKELKLAYRKRLLESHPDKVKNGDAQGVTNRLHVAYKVLSSSWEREIYDWFGLDNYVLHVNVLSSFRAYLLRGALVVSYLGTAGILKLEPTTFESICWGDLALPVQHITQIRQYNDAVLCFHVMDEEYMFTTESQEACEFLCTRFTLLVIDLKKDQEWLYRHYDAVD